ncbi:hypothetical protein APSETT445_003334 [Aspergillus pseudonomiae]
METAGREHPVDRLRDETGPKRYEEMPSRGPHEADKFLDVSTPYPSEIGAAQSDKSSSPKSQKDTSFLGHSCRQVQKLRNHRAIPRILRTIPLLHHRTREGAVMVPKVRVLGEGIAMVQEGLRGVTDAPLTTTTIIKRRKRVVPALREHSPTGATQSSNGSSASPEASPAALAPHDDHYRYYSSEPMDRYKHMSGDRISPQAPRQFGFAPPPVDFTGFGSATMSLPHHPPPPRLLEPDRINAPGHSPVSQFARRSLSPNPANPKKRTLAETASSAEAVAIPTTLESGSNQLPPIMSAANPPPPGRLSSISSILNHPNTRDESRLDPSLAALSRQQHQHSHQALAPPPPQPLPGVTELDSMREERRAQLQREAEEMREMLRAKERELAELGRQ